MPPKPQLKLALLSGRLLLLLPRCHWRMQLLERSLHQSALLRASGPLAAWRWPPPRSDCGSLSAPASVRSLVRALHQCTESLLLCQSKQQQQQQEQERTGSSSDDGGDKQKQNDGSSNENDLITKILLFLLPPLFIISALSSTRSKRLAAALRATSPPRLLISWQDARSLLAAGEVAGIVMRSDLDLAQLQLHPGAQLDGQPVEPGTSALLCLRRSVAVEVGQLLGLPAEAVQDFLGRARFFNEATAAAEFKKELRQLETQLLVPESEWVELQDSKGPGFLSGSMLTLMLANSLLAMFYIARLRRAAPPSASRGASAAASRKPAGNGGGTMTDLRSLLDPFNFRVASSEASSSGQVRFKDVAGLHEAKQELEEFVSYLKEPKRFQTLGARLPHGALLLGPPGCGKTLLVKALANEAGVPFYYKAGPEFVELIGGLGASRVRRLFEQARESAPCIIFIDELDAIGRKRSAGSGSDMGGQSEMDQTLNQLLVEMDGMDTTVGVVCFAATNRHEVLDSALLRPGRFDRHILVDLPTLIERQELFSLYLGQYRLATLPASFNKRLAALTPGRSGADIANICNEAALIAARQAKPAVEAADFEAALERAASQKPARPAPLTQEERERTAYGEAGKALVAWMLETPPPVVRVSIVRRRGGAGAGLQRLSTDRKLYTRQALLEAIACMLAGRAAETVAFKTVSSGSSDEQRAATDLAYRLVRELGMSDRVGHLSFDQQSTSVESPVRPFSKRTEALFDSEAQAVLGQAFRLAREVLTGNRDRLDRVARALLAKEELGHEQLLELLGSSPHPKPELAELLDLAKD